MKVDEKERLLHELADLEQRAAEIRGCLSVGGHAKEILPRQNGNGAAEPPLCTVACTHLGSDIICRSRPDGELTYVTAAFADLFCASVDEVLGKTFASFVANSERDAFKRISSFISPKAPERHWDAEIPSCDSKPKWIQWSILGFFDREDHLHEIQYVGRDITDLQNAQQALALEKAQLERLVQSVNSVIIESDTQGRILFINDYGLKLFGFAKAELIGRNVFSTIIPEVESTGRLLRDLLEAILQDPEGRFDHVNENIRKDGTRLWVNWRNTAVKDIHGNVTGCLAIGVDVTEQRVSQEELRRTQLMFRTVGDLIPYGVWMCCPKGMLDYVSDSFLELVDSTLDALREGDRPSLLRFDASDECLAKWHETSKSGDLWEHEFKVKAPSGEIKTILAKGVPIRNEQGETILWAGLHLDITAQKQAEEALRQAHGDLENRVAERTAELQRANQALRAEIEERARIESRLTLALEDLTKSHKDLEQFAYVTSHDLQEPLRNVASCLQLMERRYRAQLGEDADQLIAYAIGSIVRMRALILDLLAYSRVSTRGKTPEPTDCAKVIHKALRSLDSPLKESHAHVEVEEMPMVMADPAQLTLVFQNLIMNGIKFNKADAPQITISAHRRDKQWVLSVRDNGIGIEPQYLERIFTIFQRLHTKEEYDGTGMGLALSKKIIERHRGEIWVESRLGEGAVVHFTLPAADASMDGNGS